MSKHSMFQSANQIAAFPYWLSFLVLALLISQSNRSISVLALLSRIGPDFLASAQLSLYIDYASVIQVGQKMQYTKQYEKVD